MAAQLGETVIEKAMFFSPHPDDTEILAGGLAAMWAAQGVEVILCVVTNGACGSNDPSVDREDLIATRRREQRNAAVILGISEVIFLDHEDGFVEDGHLLRKDLIREMRRHKPDVVVGPDPSVFYIQQWYVNHPDHREVGKAFLAAVNPGVTTVPLYRQELYDRGFKDHALKACLMTASPNADYAVDITDYIDTKVAALDAHRSQVPTWDDSEVAAKGLSAAMAEMAGGAYRYGEAFKVIYFGSQTGASPFPDAVAAGSTAGSTQGDDQ